MPGPSPGLPGSLVLVTVATPVWANICGASAPHERDGRDAYCGADAVDVVGDAPYCRIVDRRVSTERG